MAERWRVVASPEGRNPGVLKRLADRAGVGEPPPEENVGGTVIYLQAPTGEKQEVSRVAFIRRAGVQAELSYKEAFRQEVARAQEVADSINELNGNAGVLV